MGLGNCLWVAAILQIPNLDRSLVRARREECSVRRKRDRPGIAAVVVGLKFHCRGAGGCIPPANRAAGAARCKRAAVWRERYAKRSHTVASFNVPFDFRE